MTEQRAMYVVRPDVSFLILVLVDFSPSLFLLGNKFNKVGGSDWCALHGFLQQQRKKEAGKKKRM